MKVAIFQFALFGINTYVVYDPATLACIVVDPGMMDAAEKEALSRFVEKNGLHVEGIVNTHLHIDHVIGNKYLGEKYGARVSASSLDAFLGDRLDQQARQFGLSLNVDAIKIDRDLKDGDIIKIGEGELKVLAVPGHSPGGIALYDEKDGFVISGDSLFEGSVGRTDLPGGDYLQLINAVRDKLLTLPEATKVYPGHGPSTTIARELRYNPYL
ncbi:MAG: MBL fold metallo-hydrolase [Muribaculum sp.]|nr:MBL fold metallo-hydrolase [Muribaculum sp.]